MSRLRWIYSWWANLEIFLEPNVAAFVRSVLWDKKYNEAQIPFEDIGGQTLNRPTENAALSNLTRQAWVAERLKYFDAATDSKTTKPTDRQGY